MSHLIQICTIAPKNARLSSNKYENLIQIIPKKKKELNIDDYLKASNRRSYFKNELREQPKLYDLYTIDKERPFWRYIPDGNHYAEDFAAKLEDQVPTMLAEIEIGKHKEKDIIIKKARRNTRDSLIKFKRSSETSILRSLPQNKRKLWIALLPESRELMLINLKRKLINSLTRLKLCRDLWKRIKCNSKFIVYNSKFQVF